MNTSASHNPAPGTDAPVSGETNMPAGDSAAGRVSLVQRVPQLLNRHPLLALIFSKSNLLLALVLFAGYLVREPLVGWGLPYPYEWDEPEIIHPAFRIMRNADYRPERFAYGPANAWLHAAWGSVSFVRGVGLGLFPKGIFSLTTNRDTAWYWSVTSPFLYLQARMLSVYLGLAAICFIYKAAERLGGLGVAVWAGGILVFLHPSRLQTSHITSDATSMAMCAAVIWASAWIMATRPRWAYWVAAIAIGLAVAFKYTSFPIGMVPILAHAISTKPGERTFWNMRLFWLIAGSALSFCVFMIPALADPVRFLHSLAVEAKYYGGEGSATSSHSWAILRGFLTCFEAADQNAPFLWGGLGLAILGAGGVAACAWINPKALLLLLPAVLLNIEFVTSHGEQFFDRNLLLAIQLLSILTGFLWPTLVRLLSIKMKPAVVTILLAALGTLALAPVTIRSIREARVYGSFVDPRVTLSRKMLKELPENAKVTVADEVRWFFTPEELQRFNLSTGPIYRLLSNPPRPDETDYLVLPEKLAWYQGTGEQDLMLATLNRWLVGCKSMPGYVFGEDQCWFGKPSLNPRVRLVRNNANFWKRPLVLEREVYGLQFTAGDDNDTLMTGDGVLAIPPGVPVEAPVKFSKAVSSVTLRARGLSPFQQPKTPTVTVHVLPDSDTTTETFSVTLPLGRSQSGYSDYSDRLKAPPGNYIVQLVANDAEEVRVGVEAVRFK